MNAKKIKSLRMKYRCKSYQSASVLNGMLEQGDDYAVRDNLLENGIHEEDVDVILGWYYKQDIIYRVVSTIERYTNVLNYHEDSLRLGSYFGRNRAHHLRVVGDLQNRLSRLQELLTHLQNTHVEDQE